MEQIPFLKMHGLGNDFVVLDGRANDLRLTPAETRCIADRRTGVGCDQLITILNSGKADAFMRIQNADGSEAGACGNATRCVGELLCDEKGCESITLETRGGLVSAARDGAGMSAGLGKPSFDWRKIPLREERDTLDLGLSFGPLSGGVAVNIGNPHVIFFVGDSADVELGSLGPEIERYVLFPEGVNVSAASIEDERTIRLRVWERGAGLTRSCGTAAAATLAAARATGRMGRQARVLLPGGTLTVTLTDTGEAVIAGPVETSFTGSLSLERSAAQEAAE